MSRLVPKLRFKEFSGEWEEKKLGNIVTIFKGKGISKNDITEDGELECIRYGELYTEYQEIIKDIKSKTNLKKDNLILSKKNDVIIPSSGETYIDIARASCVLKDNIALGGDLNILRGKENGIFLSYYLSHVKKHDIAKLAQGIAVVHLYASQLELLKVQLPKPKEQQKIANCLSSLDNLIEAQNKKVEALKEHKKGLMQQLFPQEGAKAPERRFEGFSGEWKVKNLGEICLNISSGKSKNDEDGKYSLFGSTGIIGKSKKFDYEGEYILVARVGANAGQVNKALGKFSVTDNTLIVDLNIDTEVNFIYFYLKSINLNNLVFGSGQPLITGKQLKQLKLLLPSLSEQQKIATCLSLMDTLIEAKNKKIEALKEHKKGLMQQLFVNEDR